MFAYGSPWKNTLLLSFTLFWTLILGCLSRVAPVIDDKPSLYDQNKNENDDNTHSEASDAGLQDETSDAGTQNETSDAGTQDEPPEEGSDGGILGPPVVDSDLPGCRIGDVWRIDLHSIPEAGEGCQADTGNAAQGDITHQLKVVARAGGGLTAELISPSTSMNDYVFQHGDFFEEGLSCRMVTHVEFGINFPNDPSPAAANRTTQVWFAYDYGVLATENNVAGDGLMTSRWLVFPDANNLDQSTATDLRDHCSEPLQMTGTIIVQ